MSEEEINAAVDLYNKYVNMNNVLANDVNYNLNIAKGKLEVAYDVLNRNWDGAQKSLKIKELEGIIDEIKRDIKAIDNILLEIQSIMRSMESQYNIV